MTGINENREIERKMSRRRSSSAPLCVGGKKRGIYEFTFRQVPY